MALEGRQMIHCQGKDQKNKAVAQTKRMVYDNHLDSYPLPIHMKIKEENQSQTCEILLL